MYPYIHTYPTYGGGFTDPHWTLEAVIFGLISCELKSLYKQVPSVLKLDAFENQWCLSDVEKLLANKYLIAYTMETAYVALIRWRLLAAKVMQLQREQQMPTDKVDNKIVSIPVYVIYSVCCALYLICHMLWDINFVYVFFFFLFYSDYYTKNTKIFTRRMLRIC